MAQIVPANHANIRAAADILRAGGVVVFPTETVYGLGADTFNPDAVGKIFALKRRPANNPLIAHLGHPDQAPLVCANWDSRCDQLAAAFWPGPLTLVTQKSDRVPLRSTAGLPTIAVRQPSHPVAHQLLLQFARPISAPSANRSGRISPTRAQHAAEEFADASDLLILDGGASDIGIESTVLDVSRRKARLLRLGSVTVQQIEQVIGEVDPWQVLGQTASPGTAIIHYSPRTPAELLLPEALIRRARQLRSHALAAMVITADLQPADRLRIIRMPLHADDYAARLYDSMRQADDARADRILIELPPQHTGVWEAIHDRLRRATARDQ